MEVDFASTELEPEFRLLQEKREESVFFVSSLNVFLEVRDCGSKS